MTSRDAEKLFADMAHKHMFFFNLKSFQRNYKTLYNVIIYCILHAANKK